MRKQTVADYGIDAPRVVRGLFVRGTFCLVAAISARLVMDPPYAATVWQTGLWAGSAQVLMAAFMIWSSKVGKKWVRDRLLREVPLRGNERVLDVGCGRGLALVGVAKRLKSGTVSGIDIWSAEDLSSNSEEDALANAQVEGVARRVEVETGDARQMIFADASFDVVVSMTALHNIPDAEGRRKALQEIMRVLKPGGYLAIFDILKTRGYAKILVAAGAKDVRMSWPILLWGMPGWCLWAKK